MRCFSHTIQCVNVDEGVEEDTSHHYVLSKDNFLVVSSFTCLHSFSRTFTLLSYKKHLLDFSWCKVRTVKLGLVLVGIWDVAVIIFLNFLLL